MSNFAKIVVIILIMMSFFFIRDKFGENIDGFFSSLGTEKIVEEESEKTIFDEAEKVKEPTEVEEEQSVKEENVTAVVYFLALDADDNGVYKKVFRNVPSGEDQLKFAITELLKGPTLIEKSTGAYSEIPKETKLLGIKYSGKKVIINFSSDFQYGGGTDSVYSRMMQLIKTAINNTENKKIYLYLDGKQINIIGGEGIMVSQPLTEKSLEI